MKRLLLVLLLLFVPLLFISCSNDDSQELEFYPQDDGTYVVAIGRAKYRENIIIPPTYNGGAVVAIDDYGFSEAPKLKTITIPDSVTSIGDRAFYYCRNLTSVVIPDSVTSIGDRAFSECYKLVEVINKSSLDITAGSSSYGYIGYYAIEVHSGESKIKNVNDYLFYSFNGVNYLFGYVGSWTLYTNRRPR